MAVTCWRCSVLNEGTFDSVQNATALWYKIFLVTWPNLCPSVVLSGDEIHTPVSLGQLPLQSLETIPRSVPKT